MRHARHQRIPNANSPELLGRLLDLVGRGVQSSRSLAESLSVEPRTVEYYLQAAEWLGFLEATDTSLTPLGLEYVFAGDDREAVYARAIWAHPVVAELFLSSNDKLPSVDVVADLIQEIDPEMAPTTVRRRASALRSLIAPAVNTRRVSPPEEGRQMTLPLGLPVTRSAPERLNTVGKREYSPEAYRYLVASLLDHGELQLRHVRGLLDKAGAERAPIGGYVDMAISRGDAVRREKSLVATRALAKRAELVDSVNSIMLSDPHYRAYLDACRSSLDDRQAAVRADEARPRYRAWDKHLFDHPASAETLDRDLESILMERPLSAFPIALTGLEPPLPEPMAFLDAWEQPHLRIACPPTLVQLQGGVAAVNRLLRDVRQRPDEARVPLLGDPCGWVHGGLLHPGETVPRAVPDTRSLRVRVLSHTPYIALATALLLVHRQQPHQLVVHRTGGRWQIRWGAQTIGPLLPFFDAFCASREWLLLRRLSGGLPDASLVDGLEALGIASTFGKQVVLSEKFFGQLRTAPEESEVMTRLRPLAAAVETFLAAG